MIPKTIYRSSHILEDSFSDSEKDLIHSSIMAISYKEPRIKSSTLYISNKTGDITSLVSLKEIDEKESPRINKDRLRLQLQELAIDSFRVISNLKHFVSESHPLQPNSNNVSEKDAQSSSKSLDCLDRILASPIWNIAIMMMTIYVFFLMI